MSIRFGCPQCQHVMSVADGNEGRKTKCPNCEVILKIPGTPAAVTPSPVPPRQAAAPDKPAASRPGDSPARPAAQGKPPAPANLSTPAGPSTPARPPAQAKPPAQVGPIAKPAVGTSGAGPAKPPQRPAAAIGAAGGSAAGPRPQPKPQPKSEEDDPFGLAGLDLGVSRSQFGDTEAAPDPFDSGDPNPFASPQTSNLSPAPKSAPKRAPASSAEIRRRAMFKLMGPGIGLVVLILITLVDRLAWIIPNWSAQMAEIAELEATGDPAQVIGFKIGFYGVFIFMMIGGFFMSLGAAACFLVRFQPLVWTGFIFAMLPCTTSYFCLLALPISIWGIVILCQKDVKTAFTL